MADVICFGNLQLDILCRPVTNLPPPGGIRMIDAVDFVLSGNAGSLAMALARLGVSVDLAGYRGADIIGEQFQALLAAEGVGVDKLIRQPEARTGTSVVALTPSGERSIIFVNGVNEAFNLDDVPDGWLHGPRLVAVTSVFVLPQFTGEAVARLLRRARAAGAQTLLNICWDNEGRGLPFLGAALEQCDFFVLNHDEGRQLTGQEAPERILRGLRECTAGTIVLTLGPRGCCWLAGDKAQFAPAEPVQATDTTGAGDAFMAGFIAGLLRGLPLDGSARQGCQVAAYALTGPGAYERIPRQRKEQQ